MRSSCAFLLTAWPLVAQPLWAADGTLAQASTQSELAPAHTAWPDRARSVTSGILWLVSDSDSSDSGDAEDGLAADEKLPATVKEAVAQILSEMPAADVELLRSTPKADLIKFHHGWGTGIRNGFGLWGRNKPLLVDACGSENCHPDDASMVIIEAVWAEVQSRGGSEQRDAKE